MSDEEVVVLPVLDYSGIMAKSGVRASCRDGMLRAGDPANALFVATSTFLVGPNPQVLPGLPEDRLVSPLKRREGGIDWRGAAVGGGIPGVAVFFGNLSGRLSECNALKTHPSAPLRHYINALAKSPSKISSYLFKRGKYLTPVPLDVI